jgi:hypothetical protein
MELEKLLDGNSSRKMVDAGVEIVLTQPDKRKELIALALSNNQPMAWHACWVINHTSDIDNRIFQSAIPQLIEFLPKVTSESQKREILRTISKCKIPEDYEVAIYDYCLELVKSKKEAIGIKGHSLAILRKMIKIYPDLKDEVKLTLTEILPYIESTGLKIQIKRDFGIAK